MSLKALTNIDLDAYYKHEPLYGGCISKDQLNKLNPKADLFYIVNMANHNEQGTHWVFIWNCYAECSYYFDSYGMPPPEEIKAFCREHSKFCYRNIGEIQCMGTSSCGWFCIYMIDQMLSGEPFLDIILDFHTDDCKANEKFLEHIFREKRNRGQIGRF